MMETIIGGSYSSTGDESQTQRSSQQKHHSCGCLSQEFLKPGPFRLVLLLTVLSLCAVEFHLSCTGCSAFIMVKMDPQDFSWNRISVHGMSKRQFKRMLSGKLGPKIQSQLINLLRSRKGEDDYLVGVEKNPGPKDGEKKRQRKPQNKNAQVNKNLADEVSKLKAELESTKAKFNAPLEQVKMDIQLQSAELQRERIAQEVQDYDNSITFPEIGVIPITPKIERESLVKINSIFIADVPQSAIARPINPFNWVLVCTVVFVLTISIESLVLDLIGLNDKYASEYIYWLLTRTPFILTFFFPAFIALLVMYICQPTFIHARLVGIPVNKYQLHNDDRPEMDRGDRMAPQIYADFELYVELRVGERYLYLTEKDDFVLPDFWFTKEGPYSRLRTLKINVGLLATALNRKTLGLRTSNNNQRVERSARLVSANAAYQEDYSSLLKDGTSSYADIQLLAGTILTGNVLANPMDF